MGSRRRSLDASLPHGRDLLLCLWAQGMDEGEDEMRWEFCARHGELLGLLLWICSPFATTTSRYFIALYSLLSLCAALLLLHLPVRIRLRLSTLATSRGLRFVRLPVVPRDVFPLDHVVGKLGVLSQHLQKLRHLGSFRLSRAVGARERRAARDGETFLRAGRADVEEATFLRKVGILQLHRNVALLCAGEPHRVELEALARVQRHQSHRRNAVLGRTLRGIGGEICLLDEKAQGVRSHCHRVGLLACLNLHGWVAGNLTRKPLQLSQVLEAILRLRRCVSVELDLLEYARAGACLGDELIWRARLHPLRQALPDEREGQQSLALPVVQRAVDRLRSSARGGRVLLRLPFCRLLIYLALVCEPQQHLELVYDRRLRALVPLEERVHRGRSAASWRIVHGAGERGLVIRVDQQSEVRHHVHDFLPCEEGPAPLQDVADVVLRQGRFQRATLRVRSVQDSASPIARVRGLIGGSAASLGDHLDVGIWEREGVLIPVVGVSQNAREVFPI
eukprot:scaffold362_cov246-Pinguiococcus_pyrenoidosus.AAC.13